MSEASKAMTTMRAAFRKDPEFAHAWHCNLAMACVDSMTTEDAEWERQLAIGNKAAAGFMKRAFDIDTGKI